MAKKIMICLNPFISHFIPTVALARRLTDLGCEVVYIGFANMESAVREEGFAYCALSSCENSQLTKTKQNTYKEMEKAYRLLHREILSHLEDVQPDLLLIGISRCAIYWPSAVAFGVKVMLYSLCAGKPGFSLQSPPVTSDYIPAKRLNVAIILAMWLRRYMRKGLALHILLSRLHYPWTTMRVLGIKQGVKWKFDIDGRFPDLPVITMGTKHFEFHARDDGHFAGLCIRVKTPEKDIDKQLPEFFEKKPLVYCCLGTMSDRYANAYAFYDALIACFRHCPQWNLLLSLGRRGKVLNYGDLPPNIQIIDFVPQMEAIYRSDLVLTHGGHGTIKECLYAGVPMVVFPCSYDQHGNASRVEYHKIGIRSPLLKKTLAQRTLHKGERIIHPGDIQVLIEKVFSDKTYANNISALRERIMRDNELEKTAVYLKESYDAGATQN